MKQITLTTDGGCKHALGAWAYVARYGHHVKMDSGTTVDATHQQMELLALLHGLNALRAPCRVTVVTDSMYLINGMTLWMQNWKDTGRLIGRYPNGSKAKRLLHAETWQELDRLAGIHDLTFQWVKGHSGHSDNEMCDRLSTAAIESYTSPSHLVTQSEPVAL